MEKVELGLDEIEPYSTAVPLTHPSSSPLDLHQLLSEGSVNATLTQQNQPSAIQESNLLNAQLDERYVANRTLFLDDPLQNSTNKI